MKTSNLFLIFTVITLILVALLGHHIIGIFGLLVLVLWFWFHKSSFLAFFRWTNDGAAVIVYEAKTAKTELEIADLEADKYADEYLKDLNDFADLSTAKANSINKYRDANKRLVQAKVAKQA